MTRVVARTRELCKGVGELPQRFAALWFAYTYHAVVGEMQLSLSLAKQIQELARQSENRGLIMLSEYALASIYCILGEFEPALAHADHVFQQYDVHKDHHLTFQILGHDPKVQSLEVVAMSLWSLGYPDQARERVRQAVEFAEALAHPYTLALAYNVASVVHFCCRDWSATQAWGERSITLSREHGLFVIQSLSTCLHGFSRAGQGGDAEALDSAQQSVDGLESIETRVYWDFYLTCVAEAYLDAGEIKAAREMLARAFEWIGKAQVRYWEAEAHRLAGELLRGDGNQAEAEASFRRAIEAAQAQSAKSLELRAVMSLARLWQAQGKGEQARASLAQIYGWFTEGFDTGDLQEARALLASLG
jgi:predicted ATPase